MHRAIIAVVVAALSTPVLQASIQLNPDPFNGSASVAFEGNATFTKTRPPVFGPMQLDATIIQKTFGSGTSSVVFNNVTYARTDLDFISTGAIGNGFRWAERIINNTGNVWTEYTLTLSETSGEFLLGGGFAQPSFITINSALPILSSGPNTLLSDDTPLMADTLGYAVLSNGNKVATFTFITPLASGSYFDIYAAIGKLPNPATGTTASFQLAQSPTQLPEAASVVVWALLGLALSTTGLRRRIVD